MRDTWIVVLIGIVVTLLLVYGMTELLGKCSLLVVGPLWLPTITLVCWSWYRLRNRSRYQEREHRRMAQLTYNRLNVANRKQVYPRLSAPIPGPAEPPSE